MTKKTFTLFSFIICFSIQFQSLSQSSPEEVRLSLDESGDRYLRFTGLAQMWFRHTQMNPGSTVNGEPVSQYSDISIRRLRFQVYGQLTDRVFFYTQFGQNNFNFHTEKYTGAFFHDAILEYAFVKEYLTVGGGLTAWGGMSRYASPSIGSILSLDAPLYQQATNGVNDQFLRKLSLYAKGQLGKLDYRLAITQPMSITGLPDDQEAPTSMAYSFANGAANKQFQGYFKYMLLDKESNLTPYQAGSYLGKKSIFNIGAGIIYQGDAMWAMDESGETVYNDMVLLGVDVFYDAPVGDQAAFTFYGAFTNYDFGSGYVRNVGVNGAATGSTGINPGGIGNAFPMVGTGNTFYSQVGYLFGKNFITAGGKFQPFVTAQYSDYDYLTDPMLMYEVGANLLTHGTHGSKLSLMYQSRPVYADAGGVAADSRKGMTVLQYQVSF